MTQQEADFDLKFEQFVRTKRASRKWMAWKLSFWVSTILLLVSQLMVFMLGDTPSTTYEFFSATQWLSLNTLTYTIYSAADVSEKIGKAKAGGQPQ